MEYNTITISIDVMGQAHASGNWSSLLFLGTFKPRNDQRSAAANGNHLGGSNIQHMPFADA